MRLIYKLCEHIKEELEDSERYIKCAFNYRRDYPDTADLFYTLAKEECDHAKRLHTAVEKIISKVENEEVPKYMKDIWNEKHEEYIDEFAEISVKIDLYTK